VHAWASRGLATIVVDPGPPAVGEGVTPGESGRPAPPRQRSLVRRAMLFGDVKGFSKLAERDIPRFVDHVMGSLSRVLDAEHAHVRSTNTWGDGLYVVLDEPVAAARCALALQDAVRAIDFVAAGLPSTLGLRLGGHVGPVFECFEPVVKRSVYFGTHVTRTARIEPVTPVGAVFVTEEFAAALALSRGGRGGHPYVCEYAGSVPAAKGYGDMRMYILKTSDAATDY
jgi:class 3 adenylate cyclase